MQTLLSFSSNHILIWPLLCVIVGVCFVKFWQFLVLPEDNHSDCSQEYLWSLPLYFNSDRFKSYLWRQKVVNINLFLIRPKNGQRTGKHIFQFFRSKKVFIIAACLSYLLTYLPVLTDCQLNLWRALFLTKAINIYAQETGQNSSSNPKK